MATLEAKHHQLQSQLRAATEELAAKDERLAALAPLEGALAASEVQVAALTQVIAVKLLNFQFVAGVEIA